MHAEKRRSLLKTATYRVICTVETFLVVWIVGGSITLATGIATILIFSKLFTYYLHERLWDHTGWGRK